MGLEGCSESQLILAKKSRAAGLCMLLLFCQVCYFGIWGVPQTEVEQTIVFVVTTIFLIAFWPSGFLKAQPPLLLNKLYVDGWNPAPVYREFIPLSIGFHTSQVVQATVVLDVDHVVNVEIKESNAGWASVMRTVCCSSHAVGHKLPLTLAWGNGQEMNLLKMLWCIGILLWIQV